MGKRALKNYLVGLPKKDLERQLMDLYLKFPVVKEYYDFVFDPREEKRIQQARAKISNEYFPLKRRRPKARRSIAQKFIKHFIKLGLDSHRIADLMLFNLEIAQAFEEERKVPDAFYKSMLRSFEEAVRFIALNGSVTDFNGRLLQIHRHTQERDWPFSERFSKALDLIS